jgi:putative sterol carrier protein
MTAIDFLKKLPAALNGDAASGMDCVLQFNTSAPAYVSIKGGAASVAEGTAPSPNVTITMADDDLIKMFKGELNGMMAFMTGKLKVDGDLMMAQRMASLFDASKL